jgi:hypothetical protein
MEYIVNNVEDYAAMKTVYRALSDTINQMADLTKGNIYTILDWEKKMGS